ncbi:hypothetical protein GVN24_31620 [Rhizobium sp. CRIBSB]|nr:hypothetical protein [Rhizobium sp. CRIBSB]
MRAFTAIAGFAAAIALTGASQDAAAQQRLQDRVQAQSPALGQGEAARAGSTQRRALRLDESGRWGVDFSLSQPQGRYAQWGDVEAGAYYRVSPRLELGASAGLVPAPEDPARPAQDNGRGQARVRLESIFRF